MTPEEIEELTAGREHIWSDPSFEPALTAGTSNTEPLEPATLLPAMTSISQEETKRQFRPESIKEQEAWEDEQQPLE